MFIIIVSLNLADFFPIYIDQLNLNMNTRELKYEDTLLIICTSTEGTVQKMYVI